MTPYEILLSESQERMLVVARADRVEDVRAIAGKWELDATPIGRVTDDGMYRVRHGERVVAQIPGERLVADCPVYTPVAVEASSARDRRAARPSLEPPSPEVALRRLLDEPAIASKRWVYEQYDSTVQAATVIGPGGDAAVVRVGDEDFGLVLATDCNARYVLLDPYEGGKAAVAEAARNVACSGARPIGITNCLNFGSPERPEVFFQFQEACRGIADACRALGIPVTGGNVSFYNESPTGAVDPTPVIGMVGLIDDVRRALSPWFATPGDSIVLLGATAGHLGGSAYWAHVLGAVVGAPPAVDLAAEVKLVDLLGDLATRELVSSAHDLAEGGLAVALAEACMGGPYADSGLGAAVNLTRMRGSLAADALLFGEDHGRAVVAVAARHVRDVLAAATQRGVPAVEIGTVRAPRGKLEIAFGEATLTWDVAHLRDVYFGAVPRRMEIIATQRAA
jgi:phosphoribosylformylglycinamidine synthase